jgi:Zn-finger nucleic acid-binding protein
MQMTCPKCHGDMRVYERSGVTVDQCTECRGIFLDRGELEKLFEAEASWNRQAAPPGRPATPAPPQPGAYTPPPPPPATHGGYAAPPPTHGGYAAPPPATYAPPAAHGYPPAYGHHGHYRHHGHYHQRRHKSFLHELFD